MRASIPVIGLLGLLSGCRAADSGCFKVHSTRGTAKSRSGADNPMLFEAFVLANPPKDSDALRLAVDKQCGRQPVLDPLAYSVQWWVFKETRSMPRSLAAGSVKRDALDLHQNDLILDLTTERGECGDFVSVHFFKDGDLVSRRTDRVEDIPGRDAGEPPSWCKR